MPPDQRPTYHFLPERNWMNDPNGLIQWRGQTHLFYQYNPLSALSGPKHWGHAVSTDLVHWQHWPIALSPTPGGPDAGGCWSGCAVDNDGVPTLIYTGIDPQVVCLASAVGASAVGASAVGADPRVRPDPATAVGAATRLPVRPDPATAVGADLSVRPDPPVRPDLRTWAKHPANPVISGPPAALAAGAHGEFRDPYVWREDGAWHLVMGCMQAGQGGLILRYRSPDLVHWDYAGVLLRGDQRQTQPFPTGTMWECPSYFQLDGQRVLIYSAYSQVEQVQYPVYYAASAGDQPFTLSAQGIVAHGPAFYAPHARRLADGRTLMFGWLKEASSNAMQLEQGWSGVMSLPLVLAWQPPGQLAVAPAAELSALRRRHWHFENQNLESSAAGLLSDIQGDCLEIEALVQLDPGAEFGLRLRAAPGGEEQTLVVYQAAEQRLLVDTRESSLSPAVALGVYSAPASLPPGGRLHLHIYLDRSVLEVFVDGRVYLAARLYPTRPDSLGLSLFSQGSAQLAALDLWQIGSIW